MVRINYSPKLPTWYANIDGKETVINATSDKSTTYDTNVFEYVGYHKVYTKGEGFNNERTHCYVYKNK